MPRFHTALSAPAPQLPHTQAFNLWVWGFSSPWGLPALAPPLVPHLSPHFAPQVIFRYALAIFKYNEEEILRLQDALEIYQYLRFFTKTICNSQ